MQIVTKNYFSDKVLNSTQRLKKLSADQTKKYLSDALQGRNVQMFSEVSIDQREAAKFIERQARILRFVSISAGMPSVTKLVEDIFYVAFEHPADLGRNESHKQS